MIERLVRERPNRSRVTRCLVRRNSSKSKLIEGFARLIRLQTKVMEKGILQLGRFHICNNELEGICKIGKLWVRLGSDESLRNSLINIAVINL